MSAVGVIVGMMLSIVFGAGLVDLVETFVGMMRGVVRVCVFVIGMVLLLVFWFGGH